MIAKLKGIVDTIGEETAIIDVGGVGYLVFASAKTLRTMPGEGEAVELLIETHVREDHITLFGFMSDSEHRMFSLLTSVQGVGTRMAMAILSVLDPAGVETAVASGDKAAISQAQGVGPKIAGRIINELKDKITVIAFEGAPKAGAAADPVFQDALSALIHLGYKPSQAHTALLSASKKAGGRDVGQLVKAGLKELSR